MYIIFVSALIRDQCRKSPLPPPYPARTAAVYAIKDFKGQICNTEKFSHLPVLPDDKAIQISLISGDTKIGIENQPISKIEENIDMMT